LDLQQNRMIIFVVETDHRSKVYKKYWLKSFFKYKTWGNQTIDEIPRGPFKNKIQKILVYF
jgi:hypothetical protein